MATSTARSSDPPPGSVHRAFALLQLVVASTDPVGVRELSRRAGLSRSTTSRLLGVLTDLGMVERTAAGEAVPGEGLASLTRGTDFSPSVLRERFRPLATQLQLRYGENAAIGIDTGESFLYLVSSRSDTAVQVSDPAGLAFSFHLIAPGLVAMAGWSTGRLDAYLCGPLESATAHSVTDAAAIRRRLAAIGEVGFAWTDQELDLEVNGLAAPIPTRSGDQVAAVATLYGPAYRLSERQKPDLGAEFAAEVRDAVS